ncbi:hypothetical protein Tco_1049367 [Tanacetum coccineum]
MEVEGFEPPQEEVIPVCKSERTNRAPNHLCLNVEAEEHSLGNLNEPTSYKAAMLDSKSNKWIDAMNAEIQSMMGIWYGSWSIFLLAVRLLGTAMKNILKYLRNTKDMFLVYGGNPEVELRVDCNAGFETNIDDIKSLT